MENDHRADNTIGYELQIGRNELNFCVLPAREPQRVKPVRTGNSPFINRRTGK